MSIRKFNIEVNPKLPKNLIRLQELANNLWYSWDRPTRSLFVRFDPKLWSLSNHNPKAVLKRIDQSVLDEFANDPIFLGEMARCLPAFDAYKKRNLQDHSVQLPKKELIAYFCAEFGLHESLPIYSGGLGILAGDHCKTASDLNLPFVAVGLLYRQGYFWQKIDAQGNQIAIHLDTDFNDLPINPITNDLGEPIIISVPYPNRLVHAKIWEAKIGHISLFLLDADIPQNNQNDRNITHQLYGGDRVMRIEQEMLLGIGGVKALNAMDINPTIWHINEGHAAFLIYERMRELMIENKNFDFNTALEAIASNTVFTTHTPVPAGHDKFTIPMATKYLETFTNEFKAPIEQILNLGILNGSDEFNMTSLAIRGSRFHNGVSRIHGGVSAKICAEHWPQISVNENPLSYVTNGVHVPTFLSDHWYEVFETYLGAGWELKLTEPEIWQGIYKIPDHQFWSIRQVLKMEMLYLLKSKISKQHRRNNGSEAHLDRILKYIDPDNPNILTIGFGRRFATYKRATLIFQDLNWLREIISNSDRPVVIIYTGKAHPADEPGQNIIRRIAEVAALPEFVGQILLLEGYDLHLSRRLISGVDVWLNNPIYPMEASGTSGMKAAINGAINLSVVDGWWGEALIEKDGCENGWGIKPTNLHYEINDPKCNSEEARELYEILQDKVIPLYYNRGKMGYSQGWVEIAKRSIATIAPQFNSARMLNDYIQNFYIPAIKQGKVYHADNYQNSFEISQWKEKIRNAWDQIKIRIIEEPTKQLDFGKNIMIKVGVYLNGLDSDDVCLELLMSRVDNKIEDKTIRYSKFSCIGKIDNDETIFEADFAPEVCGKLEYSIRIYPSHPLLTHKFELGMMHWIE